ncbi:MAG: hypothetical protein AAFQ75_15470, partial [Pseudomonadota bacterium]
PAEGLVPTISLIGTIYWFAYFLVILPVLGILETPEPQPATVEEAYKKDHPDAPAIGHNGGFIVGTGSGQTAGVGPTFGNGTAGGTATPAE